MMRKTYKLKRVQKSAPLVIEQKEDVISDTIQETVIDSLNINE